MQVLALIFSALTRTKSALLLSAFGYVSVCKHRPTCSQYALQQMAEHGTIVGLYRALGRVLTCW